MQDPTPYINSLELLIPCAMDIRQRAIVDDAHRSVINYEIYYFSSDKKKIKFDEKPYKHCGPLTDPATHQRFIPTKDSPRIDRAGRAFYFLSDSTRTVFEAHADSLTLPTYRMRS